MAEFHCEPILFVDHGTHWLEPTPTVKRVLEKVGISGQQIVLSMDSNGTALDLYDRLELRTTCITDLYVHTYLPGSILL